MIKLLKGILAFGMTALLLFACAACNSGGPDPVTTSPDTEAITTTEPDTLEVVVTSDMEDSSETTAEAITEVTSTLPGETSTVEATTGKPSTKAEIVDYFNAAYKKVKADKPGYSFRERTVIDKDGIVSSKSWLENIASLVLPVAERSFSQWSDPEVTAKGADHSDLPPYVDIDPKWIKSATCTESGGNYQIRMSLVDESVPELPKNNRNTIHGKVLDRGVFNWDAVIGGVEQIPVVKIEISKFACDYSGSYIDATVNKTTGALVKVTTWTSCQADVIAKVPIFGELDASVPLGNESEYFDFGK